MRLSAFLVRGSGYLSRTMPLPIVDRSASQPAPAPTAKPHKLHRRFDRAARLLGEPGMERLAGARIMIIGVGGVGSFTAESLARSGVGRIDLVDFDKICITNANRQLHTLAGNVGKLKVEVMAARVQSISPAVEVRALSHFYEATRADEILGEEPPDMVVDAIDNLSAKAHLVATCLRRQIPIVSSMGAAARLDPTRIEVADLAHTRIDPMAKALRKLLRTRYGFDFTVPVGVPAVFSVEHPREPELLSYDEGGFKCVCPGGANGKNDCERRRRIEGSLSFVTGAFGLAAASVVVRSLIA